MLHSRSEKLCNLIIKTLLISCLSLSCILIVNAKEYKIYAEATDWVYGWIPSNYKNTNDGFRINIWGDGKSDLYSKAIVPPDTHSFSYGYIRFVLPSDLIVNSRDPSIIFKDSEVSLWLWPFAEKFDEQVMRENPLNVYAIEFFIPNDRKSYKSPVQERFVGESIPTCIDPITESKKYIEFNLRSDLFPNLIISDEGYLTLAITSKIHGKDDHTNFYSFCANNGKKSKYNNPQDRWPTLFIKTPE